MKSWIRWSSVVFAAALVVSAGCSTEIDGAAAVDVNDSASSTEETSPSTTEEETEPSPEETPEEPADSPADDENSEPEDETPDGSETPSVTVDPATLAWMDAVCVDMIELVGMAFESPQVDESNAEEYVIAHLDYYDGMSSSINDIMAAVHEREIPGVERGAEVHESYVDVLNNIHTAAFEGAVDLERIHRTGDMNDGVALAQQLEFEIFELFGVDPMEKFMDDAELSATMEAAMDTAPACAGLN